VDDTFGYGIIGCGWVAPAHAWGVRALAEEDVRLVGVVDQDVPRAKELAERFGADAVYADYDELLAREDLSAVSVCLPDFLHRDVTLAAMAAGKHVLCEKPLALDLAGADAMVAASERFGLGLGLVMNHRYFPDNVRAHAAIRAGALGQLRIGSVLHSSGLTGAPGSPWRGRRGKSTGGVLSTQAIHFLDLLLWFTGPVRFVMAATRKLTDQQQDHEDTAAVTLQLASGALATVITTSGSPIMDDFTGTRIEVHGSHGWLLLEGDRFRVAETEAGYRLPDVELPPPPEGAEEVVFGVGHTYEVMDFVRAVRTGRQPPVPGVDGRHLMAVLDAAYTSAREGREVAVEERRPAYAASGTDPASLLHAGSSWGRRRTQMNVG
jgi:UDP-N-acetyl-2-amino-2-deoxyglucuronate dehydrogenase